MALRAAQTARSTVPRARRHGRRVRLTTPGPTRRETLRALLRGNLLDSLFDASEEYGDLYSWRAGRKAFFMVRAPAHLEHVLVARQDNYVKSFQYRLLAVGMGEGLLTNEGESWEKQRRLIQPMFAKRHLADFASNMTAAIAPAMDAWGERPDGARVDVSEEMTGLTLDVVGRALFGAGLSGEARRIGPAVLEGLRTGVLAARLQLAAAPPRWVVDKGRAIFRSPVLTPRLARFRRSMATIDEVVDRLISERQGAMDGAPRDLLGLLLAARDEGGQGMSRTQVRDEIVTFMLAGHETTANGLAWMWYLLSLHPEARERMHAEVDEVLGGRVPTADAVDRLVWTSACFQEAIRLYPPAWVFEREAVEDDALDGHVIPAGSTLLFPSYLIHRDPRMWPNPEAFDPRRFLPENVHAHPRYAYVPFGAGRRMCVGAGFSIMEATLITAMIAQRFELDLVPGTRVQAEPTVTLRPRDGLPMTVRKRA
ncbi:MAG: cytochrome P450 [Actinomycetota bacterium]